MNIDNSKNYAETLLRTLITDNMSLDRAVEDLVAALKIATSDPDQLEAYMLGFAQRRQIDAYIAEQYHGAIIFHDDHSYPFGRDE